MDTAKENFISKHWSNIIWIIGLVFIAGGVYSEFKVLKAEIAQLRIEVDKMDDQVYKEIEQRVDDLEEDGKYEKGFREGQKNEKK